MKNMYCTHLTIEVVLSRLHETLVLILRRDRGVNGEIYVRAGARLTTELSRTSTGL